MPMVSAVWLLGFFPLGIYTATNLLCNSVKCIKAKMKRGEEKALLPVLHPK